MNKRKFITWILTIVGSLFILAVGGITLALPVIAVGIVILSKNTAPLRIFIYGTLISAAIIGISLLFMNQPQCDESFTQAQIDSSKCIVGANIGLGLVFILAIGIWIMTILVSLVRFVQISLAKRSKKGVG